MARRSLLISLLDFDSFYCGVELARLEKQQPDIRNLPVGVVQRDSLIAINYVARHKGVPKMCSLATARSICPNIQAVDVNLQLYRDVSLQAFKIMSNVLGGDHYIRKASIDEAYLDLSLKVKELVLTTCPSSLVGIILSTIRANYVKVVGDSSFTCCFDSGLLTKAITSPLSVKEYYPTNIYNSLLVLATFITNSVRKAIWENLKITCSAAISPFMETSKIFASHNKPDGLTVVPYCALPRLILDLNVSKIFSIGPKTGEKFASYGLIQVSDFIGYSKDFTRQCKDPTLIKLFNYVCKLGQGKGTQEFQPRSTGFSSAQLGVSKVVGVMTDYNEAVELLKQLAVDLKERIDANVKNGFHQHSRPKTLTVKCKRIGLGEVSRSTKLCGAKVSASTLVKESKNVFDEHFASELKIVTLGITLSNFVESDLIAHFTQKQTQQNHQDEATDDAIVLVESDQDDQTIEENKFVVGGSLIVCVDCGNIVSDDHKCVQSSARKRRRGPLFRYL
ncbi:hypothetical protein P9112_008934 [Eukaryota sp. TZLM1-RC]